MQVMNKDYIRVTYAEGDRLLHELVNGSFQYGSGVEAQIVTDMDEVSMYPDAVQRRVKGWLDRNGVAEAKKDKNAILLAEQAEKAGQGTLDALVDQLGPEAKGEVVKLFTDFLKSMGKLPDKQPEAVQDLGSGKLVVNEAGNREFIPDDAALDDIVQREMEHDAKIAAGLVDSPDTAEGGELVGAGVSAGPGPMGEQIARSKPARRR